MLLYLHGFNSSPLSTKAQLVKRKLEALGRGAEYVAPALPHSPAQAAVLLDSLVERHPGAALIGSSLGGYYATWLAERHALKAALLNPAVRPYDLLEAHLGAQKKFHTGEVYEFTRGHVEELRALEVARITPARYLLVTATGDETLDYRQGVERYRGCRQVVIQGSDHSLSDFAGQLDLVLEFCGVDG